MIEFNQMRAEAPDAYLRGYGGDTSNCIIAAARLGAASGYVDARRRRCLRAEIARAVGGGRRGHARREHRCDAATGVYFVTHGPAGHEFCYLRAGSAACAPRAARLCRFRSSASARILHLSGISQAISAGACDAASPRSTPRAKAGREFPTIPTCASSCGRWRAHGPTMIATLALCDWFLPSLDEARCCPAPRCPTRSSTGAMRAARRLSH